MKQLPDQSTGGCLCGAVRYRANGTPLSTLYCHCDSCRKHTGAPVVALAGYRRDQVTYTKGKPGLFEFDDGIEGNEGDDDDEDGDDDGDDGEDGDDGDDGDELEGSVTSVNALDGTFVIAGRTIQVTADTLIDASIVEDARGQELGDEDLRFGDLIETLDALITPGDILEVELDGDTAIRIEDSD